MASRSFKSLDPGDIPSLLHVKDLDDSALLPVEVRLNDWLNVTSAPALTRSGIDASADGFYVGWISRGSTVKIFDFRKSRRNRLGIDRRDANQAVQNYFDELSTIECNKLILCISFGKLDGRSKRKCARPLNENFHKALNFPSESGHIVAAGYQGGDIDLWQVSTRTRIISLVDHKGAIHDVQFAPNGSLLLLSCSTDGFLKIWDCQDDGNMLKTLKPLHPAAAGWSPVATWSPDAGLIVGTGNSTLVAWDVADISLQRRKCPILREFRGHQNRVNVCVFSDDGSLLFSGGNDCNLIVWSTGDASILRVFRSVYPCAAPYAVKEINGPLAAFAVLDVAVHPGGDHVTAVCANGFVRVWDVADESDDPLRACFPSKRPAGCVILGPEIAGEADEEEEVSTTTTESKIVVALVDGTVQVFEHPTAEAPPSLQHLARRALRKERFHDRIDDSSKLPTRIKRYLKMEEFKPELRECDCESRNHPARRTTTREGNALASSTLREPPGIADPRGRF